MDPRLALAVSLLLAGGCQEATQLVVVVDSDLEPGVEIVAVEVSVFAGGNDARRFDLQAAPLPFSFGVVPSTAGASGPVRVVATAIGPAGERLCSLTRDTRFVPGQTLRLEMPLARACTSGHLRIECEDETTCSDGECVASEVDPESLPRGPGADPPTRLFEGPSTPVDAGPPEEDAGICVDGEACDTGNPCEDGARSCGVTPTCEVVATLPEGTSCGEGRACDGEGRCGGF